MRKKCLLFCALPIVLTFGCIETHHPPVVYRPLPVAVTTPVVVAPTSDRPAVRVYPPSDNVSSRDLAIADSIRELTRSDVVVPSLSRNVEARVENGVVTLTGTVASETDRVEFVNRISKLPGVVEVRDRTTVSSK